MNIVFLDRATLGPHVQFPTPSFNHTWVEYPNTPAELTLERLKSAHMVITNKVVITADVIAQCPHLKYIAVAATGVNVVDIPACQARGIIVANITQYATHAVAEHVFMLMLALIKQFKPYQQALNAGQWQAAQQFCFFLDGCTIQTLQGKTLGLIGTGNIAQTTAKLAQAFGMQVIWHSPSGREHIQQVPCVPLNTLLSQADVVSIHCPLITHPDSASTFHLIGAQQLQLMKPTAYLINTARGPIVNIDALLHALSQKTIAGAGLDVLPQEPPCTNSPIMQALQHPHLLLTPHTAWASQSAMQTLANQLIDKMNTFAAGGTVTNLAV